jgi:hypothetical protein
MPVETFPGHAGSIEVQPHQRQHCLIDSVVFGVHSYVTVPIAVERKPSMRTKTLPTLAHRVSPRRAGCSKRRQFTGGVINYGTEATRGMAPMTSIMARYNWSVRTRQSTAWRSARPSRRAPASVKALANDLACYADYSTRAGGIGLPASEARIVAYLEDCETPQLKPATVGRRLASLAVVHGLLGHPSPTRGSIVRDALRGLRRRVDVTQRQAGPLRFGERAFLRESARPKYSLNGPTVILRQRSPTRFRKLKVLAPDRPTRIRSPGMI